MRVINLASGSRGNATLFEFENSAFLVDCGLTKKELEQKLAFVGCQISKIKGVFISHIHTDHILGVAVFCNHYNIPVFARSVNWGIDKNSGRHYRVTLEKVKENLRRNLDEEIVLFDEFRLMVFDVSHDAPSTVGFVFESGEKKVGIVSDLGVVDATALNFLTGADLVMIEANHDEMMLRSGKYPFALQNRILSAKGHLSNTQCAEAVGCLAKRGTRFFMLMHLSEENNDPEIALSTIYNYLVENEFNANEIAIFVSSQNRVGKNFILG